MDFWEMPPASGANASPVPARRRVKLRMVPLAALTASVIMGSGIARATPIPQLQIMLSESGYDSKVLAGTVADPGSVDMPSGFTFGNLRNILIGGMGSPADNSGDPAYVDLTARFQAPTSTSATVTLALTQTNIPSAAAFAYFKSSLGGTISGLGAVSYTTYVDYTNAAFGKGILVNASGPQSIGAPPTGHVTTGSAFGYDSPELPVDLVSPYSMTEFVTFTLPTNSVLSFDAYFADPILVAEPWSLALLGGALAGFGLLRRRRTA